MIIEIGVHWLAMERKVSGRTEESYNTSALQPLSGVQTNLELIRYHLKCSEFVTSRRLTGVRIVATLARRLCICPICVLVLAAIRLMFIL